MSSETTVHEYRDEGIRVQLHLSDKRVWIWIMGKSEAHYFFDSVTDAQTFYQAAKNIVLREETEA